MSEKDKAHYGPEEGTNVLPFPGINDKEQSEETAENRKAQEQNQKTDEYERYRKKYRRSKKLWWGIAAFTIALMIFLEKVLYRCIDCISWESLLLTIPAFLVLFIDVIISAGKNDNYSNYDKNDFYERVVSALKSIRDAWHSKPIIEVCFIALTVGIIAVFGSKFKVCARAEHAIREFFKYNKEVDAKSENDQSMSGDIETAIEKTGVDIVKASEKKEESISESEEKVNNDIDNYDPESEDIIVTEFDRNLELNLPESHYNDIFHLEGEFTVEDWNDQEAIDEVVLAMVRDENSQQKENKFDENEIEDDNKDEDDNNNVLSELRSRVSAASENEKKENTFSGRIEIMETRMDAYDSDPKSSLAKLVSNDNQALALALVQNDGKKQTEMYFYGESILWGREYIGFADVSASSVKEKLNWIAERYKDIRFICSEEDPEYIYADRLMKAYQHAANEF